MTTITTDNMSDAYSELVSTLLQQQTLNSPNPTKELTNVALVINKPYLEHIHYPLRKLSKAYLQAELQWYWSASNSVDEIGKAAKLWYNITDDGTTSNSAYGYIIHKKYGYDQLSTVFKELKRDPTSRRAIINISDPLLDKQTTKDLQCTIAIQFLIRDNRLHMTVYMRSNDVYFGLPYDSIYFMTIQHTLANELRLNIGTYTHHATSMHIYERDIDKLVSHNQMLNIQQLDIPSLKTYQILTQE